jgi:hypothetical protein
MAVQSQPLPERDRADDADRRAYLEQRLFAYSPFNLWVTAALVYALLIGAYGVAAGLDHGAWIIARPHGYALDESARVALILTLVAAVALGTQRYTRVRELAELPSLAGSLSRPMEEADFTFEPRWLKRATALGLVGGVVVILVTRWAMSGPADVGIGSARFVWFAGMTLLLSILFARGVEMTRTGSAVVRRAVREDLTVDLMHVDRLYVWGRTAARNSLTWFAVSASACLLFISRLSPLVSAALLGACAAMGLWGFVGAMEQVHRRIRAAKVEELETVRAEITALRTNPGPEPETALRLHSLLAYEARIAAVHEWPFDQSTLTRVLGSALILALPWFGQAAAGALVEHAGRLLH